MIQVIWLFRGEMEVIAVTRSGYVWFRRKAAKPQRGNDSLQICSCSVRWGRTLGLEQLGRRGLEPLSNPLRDLGGLHLPGSLVLAHTDDGNASFRCERAVLLPHAEQVAEQSRADFFDEHFDIDFVLKAQRRKVIAGSVDSRPAHAFFLGHGAVHDRESQRAKERM